MFRESSAYQPFGDLVVRSTLPDTIITGYRRSLSLDDAVARTEFSCGGVAFVRETFASFTDDVVVHRLSSDRKGAVAFEATIASPHDAPSIIEGGRLVSRGVAGAIFSAIGEAGINIRMIDQGSSELNIIAAVEEKDMENAIRAIYARLEQGVR